MPDAGGPETVANKHGCLPPSGCRLPTDPTFPRVAIGRDHQDAYGAMFLVKPSDLERCLYDIVNQSWTLKAWFSYKIHARGLKDACDLEAKFPTWDRVWEYFKSQGPAWNDMYRSAGSNGSHASNWELGEPKSTLDLLVSAIFILGCIIGTNSYRQTVEALRWHEYYYEMEGKVCALYRFILYQHTLFGPNRTGSIHPPSDASRIPTWQQSWGYRIREAAEDFVKGV
jgi:hypothetical protein